MKTLTPITQEKFETIYTDEKFRNCVAYAHGCNDRHGNHLYMKANSYPDAYIVEQHHIDEAKKEVERAKTKAIKDVKNKLVFVGMGMNFEGREPEKFSDVNNHRIRTEFINDNGRHFFIELRLSNYGDGTGAHISHAIDRDLQKSHKGIDQPYNNYNNIERRCNPRYTKEAILKLINREFDCSFEVMEVDQYNLSTDDFICTSPGFKKL